MPWPLEPDGIRAFAEGLEEVLVIEEKREFIEHQLRWQLYNWREAVRPRVVGKHDEDGDWLLSPDNELTPGTIAHVIAARIQKYYDTDAIRNRLAFFNDQDAQGGGLRHADQAQRPISARAARTTPRPRRPRARGRWPASAATSWRCGWTAPRPSPRWAARA